MLDKMAFAVYSSYLKAKAKLMKLGQEEDGMETLETVILIAIAVVVAGIIINVLTKGHIGNSDQGLIGYMFQTIKEKLENVFNGGSGFDNGLGTS